MNVLVVALGGAIGSALRWGVGRSALEWFGSWWIGTLIVNIVGSFSLALLSVSLKDKTFLGTDALVFWGAGVMGGFTTYSTFNFETLSMWQSGEPTKAMLYILFTVLSCLLAGYAGYSLLTSLR